MRKEDRPGPRDTERSARRWRVPAVPAAMLAAWALSLGPGCGEPGEEPATAACVTRELFWDDGRGVLHPAYEPIEPANLYRCASPELRIACPNGRARYQQDLIRHLRPETAAGEDLVRCVGPAFQG